MITKSIATTLTLLALSTGGVSTPAFADSYPMTQKLEQCESAFKKSHSGDLTRAEAAKARQEHMKLVQEILREINLSNAEAKAGGKSLSPDEVLNNLTVMGRLLEMLATDHAAPKADWSYVY